MGIIVDPVAKKLPHAQVDCNYGIDILNPKARQHWNAPAEEFETPLEYNDLLCRNDVCTIVYTIIWLLQLVQQVQSLSSFAPPHEDTLTVQYPGGVVASFPYQIAWE